MLEVINKNPVDLPTTCPECGHTLEWNGVHLQCPNKSCKNLQKQDVLCWFHALAPVEGLGDALILKFLDALFGDRITVEQIYSYGKVFSYSASAQKSLFISAYNKLFDSDISIEDAIRALNIPRFGDITAAKCSAYSAEFQLFLKTGKLSDNLKALGVANFEALRNNTDKLIRLHLIADQINWTNVPIANNGEVCITGKLSVKRSVFESELKEHGFTTSNSVKKSTKYLITDDPNSGTSKNAAADKYGIPKISEAEFRAAILQ